MEVEPEPAALEVNLPEEEARAIEEDRDPAPAPAADNLIQAVPAKWIRSATNLVINAAVGASRNITCGHCSHESTSRKRLLLHCRLHWTQCFCACGYTSRWRETIKKHHKDTRNDCSKGPVFEVDWLSFPRWLNAMGLPASTQYPSHPAQAPPTWPAGERQPAPVLPPPPQPTQPIPPPPAQPAQQPSTPPRPQPAQPRVPPPALPLPPP